MFMISDIRTQPQVDETSNLLVTFGLHGKDILINDMRVSGNGVAIACECISQASSPSCTFFSRAFSIAYLAIQVGLCRVQSCSH